MKRLSKTSENLKKVSGSICVINFHCGKFKLSDISGNCAHLVSAGRDGIGNSILSMIPTNWIYRVSFDNEYLHLHIFI